MSLTDFMPERVAPEDRKMIGVRLMPADQELLDALLQHYQVSTNTLVISMIRKTHAETFDA